jgi:hypothetical protein
MSSVPEPQRFFLEVAPYASFDIGPGGFVDVMRVQFFRGTLDTYCIDCGRESVFQPMSPSLQLVLPGPRTGPGTSGKASVDDLLRNQYPAVWPYELKSSLQAVHDPRFLSQMEPLACENRVFQVRFTCTRDEDHSLYFFFQVQNGRITKVGQSPSLADLYLGGVKKYRKVLGDEKYREFTKAIGLHAHGVGIGAFVYLRRIFEDLIASARQEATKAGGWDEAAFVRSRMDEKIHMLQGRLPRFLVDNRGIYSILSCGLHELNEQECLNIFEPLKVGIELILDEKLEQQERAAKVARTTQALSKIKGQLGPSNFGT